MLERFQNQISSLTKGQRWRLQRFLYKLEETNFTDEQIERHIRNFCIEEFGLKEEIYEQRN